MKVTSEMPSYRSSTTLRAMLFSTLLLSGYSANATTQNTSEALITPEALDAMPEELTRKRATIMTLMGGAEVSRHGTIAVTHDQIFKELSNASGLYLPILDAPNAWNYYNEFGLPLFEFVPFEGNPPEVKKTEASGILLQSEEDNATEDELDIHKALARPCIRLRAVTDSIDRALNALSPTVIIKGNPVIAYKELFTALVELARGMDHEKILSEPAHYRRSAIKGGILAPFRVFVPKTRFEHIDKNANAQARRMWRGGGY